MAKGTTKKRLTRRIRKWRRKRKELIERRAERKARYILVKDRRELFLEVMGMLIDRTKTQTAEKSPDSVLKMFNMIKEVKKALERDAIDFKRIDKQNECTMGQYDENIKRAIREIVEFYRLEKKQREKDKPLFVLIKKEKIKKDEGKKKIPKKRSKRESALRNYYIEMGIIKPK